MKAKRFVALVRIWRFVPPCIDQGTNEIEHEGTMVVNRATTVWPVWRGCTRQPLRSREYFWITYRGKRYPVDRAEDGEGVAYEVRLASDDNPLTATQLDRKTITRETARETALARELLHRGLVAKAKTGRQKGGRR